MSSGNNVKALKSGIWYTVANFLTRSIGFITTPIFTRLLTHDEYGLYNNYISWQSTLIILVTLNLTSTFISARFEFEDDFDGYISSVMSLSFLSTLIWTIAINLFPAWFVNLTGVELRYLNILMVYLLFYSAIEMFQTRERYYFEYKISVLISVVISVGSSLLSVLLVLTMENRLAGRIIGNSACYILIGSVLLFYIYYKGRKVDIKYWLYALPICTPFIPHLLSLTLLNSMDRIMITRICGAEDNALYSLAYNCGAIITLLVTSLNTAFAPWLGEKLNDDDLDEIRSVSEKYVFLFVFLAAGIMLIVPEILLLMGGPSYLEAIYVMPPVAFGCVCQFIYIMYVNIEQFKKKTVGMAFASVSAAALNYILNALLIPRFGYVAAAYTTLVSFLWLAVAHMYLVKRLGYLDVYNTKLILTILAAMSVYTVVINYVYRLPIIRYAILAVYTILFICAAWKYKGLILSILKRRKGRKA